MLGRMRADRLVATLLVLQARGRVTAAELAAELEVSERTARRDLEALAMAGMPVYAQQGRRGGWSLLGGARTDLSGLTAAEARALFLLVGAGATGAATSVTPQVTAALRKLVRALPETFRTQAERAGRAVLHDTAEWDRPPATAPAPAHLAALQNAVIDGVRVRLRYAGRDSAESERTVDPLGLVAKGPAWYLIAATPSGLRTFRVSRIRDLAITAEPAQRPDGFDLDEAWRSIVATLDERRMPCRATVRVDTPETMRVLQYVLGTRITVRGEDLAEVRGPNVQILAAQLAGFADHVEVESPPEVRAHLHRLGVALARRYADAAAPGTR